MRYLVLLYGSLDDLPEFGTPESDAEMAAYAAFDDLAGDAVVGGEALELNEACRTVRHHGGTVQVTDGPYAEVAEGLGGFYVLEAPSLDDVIELARHLPAASDADGAVELRPIVEWVDRREEVTPPPGATRYLATIHGTEDEVAETPGTDGWDAGADQHAAFGAAAGDALLAAVAVHPTSTATTIRVRDGGLLVSDGPFAEAVEVVGGAYVLAGTLDQVLDLAARIPVPSDGAVELRPIMDFGGMELDG